MGKLTQILGNEFRKAQMSPGYLCTTNLAHGMSCGFIMNVVDGKNVMKLVVARERVYPSKTEWDTTVKHLPLSIPKPKSIEKMTEIKNVFYLSAAIPEEEPCTE